MKIYIGKREEYSSFELLQKAYWIRYSETVSEESIVRNSNGKPYFKSLTMPFFSISHSGDYLACVFDEDEVGLDIQKIRRIPQIVIRKYLHTVSTDPVQQIFEWTKIESYGKMNGSGIPTEDDYDQGVFVSTSELDGYAITICTKSEKNQAIELVYI